MEKRNIFMLALLLLFNSSLVWAETLPGISEEISLPDNFLTNALQPILQKVGIFIGGIFGLYVILTLLQFYNERKKIRLLKDIRNDLDLLTKHFGVKHSHDRRGIFSRVFGFLWSDEESKKGKK
ncbi:MAG: hypothetical protein A3D44_01355 [Candidatus Staskawiczbacteria bacterium RIFCSPHIGHO2_02_FULL_42_22]|uniref:Uncharacterized protein n=1 Tax=Candidatus Staskawiczbacteria bacterium RIFCSPHIGHO2_02_FULL_42_22 TaxID=1802207 RepID=A0A1G2I489_9BACT|nr:MAG: hypothetical protein A3D44_01355 [Candidatus Staskawiczbacteria bacterium RIFCSPHIGHO2_02_FULL_42_22]HLD79280.1 hypothetical protein [Candidatus Nanoarchaeia archaeon]